MASDTLDLMHQRAVELQKTGLEFGHAFGLSSLESRISNWPPGYGADLVILIYGDFKPPDDTLRFDHLGITVHPEKVENSAIRGAFTVLKANVTVPEKSVSGVLDAIRRINVLLGSWSLLTWSNAGIGWWNYLTHGPSACGWHLLNEPKLPDVTSAVLALPPRVQRKIQAALYWIREPRGLMMEQHQSDALRLYAGYWNAFECLVDAVCILRPQVKESRETRQARLDEYLKSHGERLTLDDVGECYRQFVDPGFVAKASYVFRLCFREPESYIEQCFKVKPKQDQLYNIRNSINHGEIDAENPTELIRIESKQSRLSQIVMNLFGCILRVQ